MPICTKNQVLRKFILFFVFIFPAFLTLQMISIYMNVDLLGNIKPKTNTCSAGFSLCHTHSEVHNWLIQFRLYFLGAFSIYFFHFSKRMLEI